MKEKGTSNANRLISEITCLEQIKLPVIHVKDLSSLLYEIEILEQEVEDLPEGKEKEWCKQHLRQKHAELIHHETRGSLQ